MSDVSESLRSLTKNEQPWAIHSGHSEEMSDVSKSLISLTKNEQMSESLIFGQKTSNLLGNPMSEFPALVFGHLNQTYTVFLVSNLFLETMYNALLFVQYLVGFEYSKTYNP